MKIYTGIGSRETPKEILILFFKIAQSLAKRNYTLRSGGANGADTYFEIGCDKVNGNKEIYLTWKGFNNSKSNLIIQDYSITPEPYDIASQYRRNFFSMKQSVQKLLARDVYQVLGFDLQNPTDFIICYTPNGKLVGGTSLALQVAKDNNIKVFNAGSYNDLKLFVNDIKEYIIDRRYNNE